MKKLKAAFEYNLLLLSGRRMYWLSPLYLFVWNWKPSRISKNVIAVEKGEVISRTQLLQQLVQSLYSRTTGEFNRGNFRVKGDVIDIFPGYADVVFKIHFFGDEIEEIESFDPIENKVLEKFDRVTLFPANMFVTSPEILQNAITQIQDDLVKQVEYFNANGFLEAKRLHERTEFDLK